MYQEDSMKLEVNIISMVTKVGVGNNGYLNKDVFAIHKDVQDVDVDDFHDEINRGNGCDKLHKWKASLLPCRIHLFL